MVWSKLDIVHDLYIVSKKFHTCKKKRWKLYIRSIVFHMECGKLKMAISETTIAFLGPVTLGIPSVVCKENTLHNIL